ncbi:hypothetical protein OG225_41200 (plasmid) [Nocardia sp. NBC_01377]
MIAVTVLLVFHGPFMLATFVAVEFFGVANSSTAPVVTGWVLEAP